MSILIGLHINQTLAANAVVAAKVGTRIFPIVAPMGVEEFPFITFQSSLGAPEGTKDGWLYDYVNTSLTVVAKSYSDAVELAMAVRQALEGVEASYDQFRVNDCTLDGVTEAWLDDLQAYAVELTFTIRSIN